MTDMTRSLPRLPRTFAVLTLALATLAGSRASAGTTILYNQDNRPIAVTELTVGAEVYDVTLTYNVSFDSIWGTSQPPSPAPEFYGDTEGAAAARTALCDALNGDTGRPGDPAGNTFIWTPYDTTSTHVTVRQASYTGDTWFTNSNSNTRTWGLNPTIAYAQYAPAGGPAAVPTLSEYGVAALVLLLACMAGRRLRRSTRAMAANA